MIVAVARRSDTARRRSGRCPSAARSDDRPRRRVPGSTRRSAASATHGDASSFCRHALEVDGHHVARRASPSSSASTSPRDSRSLPRDGDPRHGQRLGRQHQLRAAIHADSRRRAHDDEPARQRPPRRRATTACRAGLTCARRKRLSAGAATGISAPPSLRCSASISRFGTVPIEPAPSVITASPGRTIVSSSRHDVVERRDHVHRPARAAADRRRPARSTRDAGNRLLAGGVDVGQHDLVGVRRAPDRTRPAAARSASSGAAETPRSAAGRASRGPRPAPRRSRSGGGRSRRRPARRRPRRAARSAARRPGSPRSAAGHLLEVDADALGRRPPRPARSAGCAGRAPTARACRAARVPLARAPMHDAAAAERAELDVACRRSCAAGLSSP